MRLDDSCAPGDFLFMLAAPGRPLSQPYGRVPLPGLDTDSIYHFSVQAPGDGYPQLTSRPGWMRLEGVELSGRALEDVGLDLPPLHPDRLVLVRATKTSVTQPVSRSLVARHRD
ncbi:hypothetical protein [Glaciihabitans sp. UYNi722]|uniref:hypothetical protein n=1 Tax=Glaciihabitans sp. UYNi722 TaxID=3156344 RepID=UPI003394B7DE